MPEHGEFRYIATELGRRMGLLEAEREALIRNNMENRADIAAIKEDVAEIVRGQKKVRDDFEANRQNFRRSLRNASLTVAGSILSGGILYVIVSVTSQ